MKVHQDAKHVNTDTTDWQSACPSVVVTDKCYKQILTISCDKKVTKSTRVLVNAMGNYPYLRDS